MKTSILSFALGLLLMSALLTSAAPHSTKPKQHTNIHARYVYAAETVYRDIIIEGLTLKLTYFQDADNRCQNWLEQRPCWTPKDLRVREAQLSKKDLRAFVKLLNQSGFLSLERTYGGAGAGQRYYSETLNVKLGEVQHQVIYQSFPAASPPPQAFTKVARWLSNLVKKTFKL
ncbi:MAG: hypothetical protein HY231_00485 [Acidobacteria bacterium]|nr:hypothetical protein [Acidobacteriota bacterium]